MGSHKMKELYKKKSLENIQSFKNDIRLFAKENELVIQETDETGDSPQWVCQMKKESKISLGIASKATTIIIDKFSDDTLKISVGQGKWLSKIAGSAATALVTGPLFLIAGATAVTGIFGQMSLTKRILDLVEVNFE